MTITEAAEKYGTDGAAIWAWISSERTLTAPDGRRVILRADHPNERGPWVVREEEVSS